MTYIGFCAAILFFSNIFCAQAVHPIVCRDPDVGGTAQNKDRKFLILGSPNADAGGAGIGNLLIFYPSAFYFAAFTGRDIIISDKSALGELCAIVNCGFPFVSQLSLAFPSILNEQTLAHVEEVKVSDFNAYMDERKVIEAKVVRAGGYQPKGEWWVWYNTTVHCVKKITGCDLGDIMCAERHAYQRLIRGPFKASLTDSEEKRIHGVPAQFKHAILTLPHQYAPRLDMAIHLRTQFHNFEQQIDVSDPGYKQEVNDWLNGTECASVFAAMSGQIEGKLQEKEEKDKKNTLNATSKLRRNLLENSLLDNTQATLGLSVDENKILAEAAAIRQKHLHIVKHDEHVKLVEEHKLHNRHNKTEGGGGGGGHLRHHHNNDTTSIHNEATHANTHTTPQIPLIPRISTTAHPVSQTAPLTPPIGQIDTTNTQITTTNPMNTTTNTQNITSKTTTDKLDIITQCEDPLYIYLASDNEDVKEAFMAFISKKPEMFSKIRVMRVVTTGVYHVKNMAKLKSATDNEGLLDLVFDWYALSLANNVYAWRKGSTTMVSTFVHSAQKVSGTTERTDNQKGTGIGTRGYQLIKDRRGNARFDLFWCYTFIEDYQI